jgi:hypothetical protein
LLNLDSGNHQIKEEDLINAGHFPPRLVKYVLFIRWRVCIDVSNSLCLRRSALGEFQRDGLLQSRELAEEGTEGEWLPIVVLLLNFFSVVFLGFHA